MAPGFSGFRPGARGFEPLPAHDEPESISDGTAYIRFISRMDILDRDVSALEVHDYEANKLIDHATFKKIKANDLRAILTMAGGELESKRRARIELEHVLQMHKLDYL
ncbi:hypothetical protein ACFX2C_035232 [Malus domestica]